MKKNENFNLFYKLSSFVVILTLTFSMMGSLPTVRAQSSPGDILVVDIRAGTDNRGALFRVNPVTGNRELLSDFGNINQGLLGWPSGVVIEAAGTLLVVARNTGTDGLGALFRVDPVTGMRKTLSDFGDPTQGPLGDDPVDVAIEEIGTILVLDRLALDWAALFRVDPVTGIRTVLSEIRNPAQGPPGRDPKCVTVEADGTILVTDNAGWGPGALFRVNPVTGMRTILSNFGDPVQGPTRDDSPSGVAVEATGTILVINSGAIMLDLMPMLYRIDQTTGMRTILSDFGDLTQGPLLSGPGSAKDVVVEATGTTIVPDSDAGTDASALYRIDPTTGMRTILSDFGDPTQGPLGRYGASSVAIVPGLPATSTSPPPIPLFSDVIRMLPLGFMVGVLVLTIKRRQAKN